MAKTRHLSPADWKKIIAFWESGEVTLEDLEAQFGVSKEHISRKLTKLGIVKGSKAGLAAEKVAETVAKTAAVDARVRAARIAETKERYTNWLNALAQLAMQEIIQKARDKKPLGLALANLKAIEKARNIIGATREDLWAIFGIDKDDPADPDNLPTLPVLEMTEEQIKQLREGGVAVEELGLPLSMTKGLLEDESGSQDEDEEEEAAEGDDDIVVEMPGDRA